MFYKGACNETKGEFSKSTGELIYIARDSAHIVNLIHIKLSAQIHDKFLVHNKSKQLYNLMNELILCCPFMILAEMG